MTNNLNTIIHEYSFYVNEPAGKADYEALKAKLEDMGLKCFKSHGSGSHYNADLDGRGIELETKHLFNNQWNTAPLDDAKTGLRVFDWAQDYRPYGNKYLKRGHWLEQTPAMAIARSNRMACGYCGHQVDKHNSSVPAFCPRCIDSEYLQASELHLTRMQNILIEGPRKPLNTKERAQLLPLYKEAQLHGTTARGKARLAQQRIDIETKFNFETHNATIEHDGFIWLLDHGLQIDNCIYYSHTGKFSFGWRAPVSVEIESALLDVISEFPYPYEIKCADGSKREAA